MKYKSAPSVILSKKNQISETQVISEKNHVEEKSYQEKIQITFFSLLVFVAGLTSKQTINLVGEIYIVELLLPLLAIILLFMGKAAVFREKIFWQFVILGICMILGYIISDLVAGTDSIKYFRAWGRNFLLLIDFISLAIIVGADRRLIWWFILGVAVGALSFLIIGNVSIHDWKFGYSQPLILVTILSGYFLPYRITALTLVVLGIISIYMDSRSASAFCLFVAGVIYIRIKKPEGLKLSPLALFRISAVGIVLSTMLIVVMNLTQDEFSDRRESSSFARFAALRIGVVAIADSPVLGHGSWGEGTEEYAGMMYDDMKRKMAELDRRLIKGDVFRPHSQLIQSWMEGGFFAAVFFLFFGYQLAIRLKNVILVRRLDYLTPLYANLLLGSAWHLVMSPFGGAHRVGIATSVAIICLLVVETRKKNGI